MNRLTHITWLAALLLLAFPAYGASDLSLYGEPVKLEYNHANKRQSNRPVQMTRAQHEALLSERAARQQVLSQCKLTEVAAIVDQRQNKQTLGSTLSRPLLIDGLDDWLTNIKSQRIDSAFADVQFDGADALQLRPSLTRLYTYAEGMNLYGVSAMRMDLYRGDELVLSRQYRGFGSKANMWNAASEYHEAANRAIDDLLDQFLGDMETFCGITTSAT